ncbi:MAG: ketopantoate reductase family protein [Marmoricola sp.]
MRFVVVGLGAVGGSLAVRLCRAGHEVTAIARGAQLDAVRRHGLRLESPTDSVTATFPVCAGPAEVRFGDGDVVVLATKSQHTAGVLTGLANRAPEGVAVLSAQNGVANEPEALRYFPHVYGVVVMCPTAYLEPGTVRAYSAPVTGLLDVGCWPDGEDDTSRAVAAALTESTYDSRSVPDVRRWKYAKLLTNLGNPVEAVCGPQARPGPLVDLLRAEGEAVLAAAGIEHASAEEDRERRGDLLRLGPIDGQSRPGGSTWQSLARGAGSTEADHLCGEVVRLGRLHGVPTPGNALLQRLARELVRGGALPGGYGEADLLARLDGR